MHNILKRSFLGRLAFSKELPVAWYDHTLSGHKSRNNMVIWCDTAFWGGVVFEWLILKDKAI